MPGLGGRMSTVVKAKISKLLDRAEQADLKSAALCRHGTSPTFVLWDCSSTGDER